MVDASQFAADSAAITPADEALKNISALAQKQLQLEAECADLENQLSLKKEALNKVKEFDLPEAMTAVGMKEFKLEDGRKIEIKPYYSAKIDDENQDKCFAWLRDNEHGDLIKNEFKVAFGKGADVEANALAEMLRAAGYAYTSKESVHFQTLSAFVREQVENNGDLPLDLFKVHIGRIAKVSVPRASKR